MEVTPVSDVTMPVIGQEPWGETLNTCLEYLYEEIERLSSQIATHTTQIAANSSQTTTNTSEIVALKSEVAANQTAIINMGNDVGAMFARLNQLEAQVSSNTNGLNSLGTRVSVVEDRPDFVFVQTSYMFSTASPPATGNQIRLDNADPKLATILDVRRVDADGADRSYGLSLIDTKSQIRLNVYNDASNWHRFTVIGTPTKAGPDNWYVPVAWHSGVGTLPGSKINVGLFIDVPYL